MKKYDTTIGIVKEVHGKALASVQNYATLKEGMVLDINSGKVEEEINKVPGMCRDLVSFLRSSAPVGVYIPDCSMDVVTTDIDTLKSVRLTVRNKGKNSRKYKRVYNVTVDINLVNNLFAVIEASLMEMFYSNVAFENLKEMNSRLATMCEEAGVSYKVEFTCDGTENKISYISDELLVLNTSVTGALNIGSLMFMCDTVNDDNFVKYVQQDAYDSIVKSISACQTTVELSCARIFEFQELTGDKKSSESVYARRAVRKHIRQIVSKNSTASGRIVAGATYYYSARKDIDGQEVEVFGLVQADEDKKFHVLLSPYDVRNLTRVDVDLLGLIEKERA